MRASCRIRIAVVTVPVADYHLRMPEIANADLQIVERPGLYATLHQPFELGRGERIAARVLLALLRLPGGAGLLLRWHARRGA
jgi:hypothetical protein